MFTKLNKAVTKTKIVEIRPATMTLTITKEEAGRLKSVLEHIIRGDGVEDGLYDVISDWIGDEFDIKVEGDITIV